MNKFLRPAAATVAAALMVWAAVAFLAGNDRPGPPLGGAMRNFTVTAAGSPVPQTPLAGRDGAPTTLRDAARGRLTLVNFWATWCAPCVKEMPSLQRLQAQLGGDRFTVLALSEDLQGWPIITPFLARLGLDWLPVLHDIQGATSRALKVSGLPTTILFDREGREIGRLTGVAEWDDADALALIRHYLGPAPPR